MGGARPREDEISDEALELVINAIEEHKTNRKAAVALGMSEAMVSRRKKLAAKRGLTSRQPVMPGFHIAQVSQQLDQAGDVEREWVTQKPEVGEKFVLPEGMALQQVSALTDAAGNIKQSWQIARKDKDLAILEMVEYLKSTFDGSISPHVPIPPPAYSYDHLCTLIPCNDWHINMLAWERETAENWDLKISEEKIGNAMDAVIIRSPPSRVAIVLGGGDLMHTDNNLNRTAASGAVLDADSRYAKGRQAAIRLMVKTVDLSLAVHGHVIVRLLKGNHDEYSSSAIACYLSAWYKNEPRVTIDLDESVFWTYQHGTTMLSATHGHTIKMNQFASIMAGYWPVMWGATKFRYGHFFHIHHRDKVCAEGGGVVVESHRAPVPKDGWHYGSGYLSGRDVQTITYHEQYGEIGRVSEVILDA